LEDAKSVPEFLYRYVDLPPGKDAASLTARERVWDAIQHSRLYFSSPSGFNDPFDCRARLSTKAAPEVIREFWRASTAYKDSPVGPGRDERIEDLVRSSGTEEDAERLQGHAAEIVRNCGIACCCEIPDSLLMWAYYSGGHRGVCLRINMRDPGWERHEGVAPMRVAYTEEFPLVKFYTGLTSAFIRAILLTKSEQWSHEHEWRLVRHTGGGLTDLPPGSIDAVILGLRTDDSDRDDLYRLVQKRKEPLRILRTMEAPYAYRLDMQERVERSTGPHD
jgi:hypothetical protein